MWVRSLASLSELRIRHCCTLQCRLQMWLGSWVAVAVAQAGSCRSDSTPSLGTSTCCTGAPPKKKRKKEKMSFIMSLPSQRKMKNTSVSSFLRQPSLHQPNPYPICLHFSSNPSPSLTLCAWRTWRKSASCWYLMPPPFHIPLPLGWNWSFVAPFCRYNHGLGTVLASLAEIFIGI